MTLAQNRPEQFTFQTAELKSEIVSLKGGKKKYLLKGWASTVEPDDLNDIVLDSAQDQLAAEFKTGKITIDLPSHASWVDPKTGEQLDFPKDEMPIGKVTEATRKKEPKNGVYVTVEMNTNHPFFTKIWKSIQEGFYHSFSVAYFPLKKIKQEIAGKMFNLVASLNLVNMTITGNPRNKGAEFSASLKSALAKIPNGENMDKDVKQPASLKSYEKDGGHAHTEELPLGEHNHPEIEKQMIYLENRIDRYYDYVNEKIEDLKSYGVNKDSADQSPGLKSGGEHMGDEQPKPEDVQQPAAQPEADAAPADEGTPASPEGEGSADLKAADLKAEIASLKAEFKAVKESNETLKQENADLKGQFEDLKAKVKEPALKGQLESPKPKEENKDANPASPLGLFQ